jgi:hypothetical protein
MDVISRTYPAGDLRISDADRDAVVAELSEHYQAGRLTIDELDERTGRAISARTGNDLDGLLADLPAGPGATPGSAGAAGTSPGLPGRGGRRLPCPLLALPPVPIIAVVAVALAVLGQHGVAGVLWWLIPVWYLVVRRRRSNGR